MIVVTGCLFQSGWGSGVWGVGCGVWGGGEVGRI